MAKVDTSAALLITVSAQSVIQASSSVESFVAPSVGKTGRTNKRDRSFRDIIGRAQKRFRGRFGGETQFDERYWARRRETLARVSARQRADQHFTSEQLRYGHEGFGHLFA
jgi:hypothetical protein